MAERSSETAIAVAIGGLFLALLLYAAGVMIAAHGQLLLTSVDAVINNSPFLKDSERASIMRISLKRDDPKYDC